MVSVVVPTYNRAGFVGDAVTSLLTQGALVPEVVVVDDGSTDGSACIAKSYPGVIVESQANAGNGSARNRAVELSSGDVLAFMDADDRSRPDRLERQWAVLSSGGLDAVFGHVQEFVSPDLSPQQRASVRPAAPEPSPWISANLMMVTREAFERVGPFSETLRVGVTVDWCARAVDSGLRTAVLPEVVLERRLHLWNNGIRESESKAQYVRVMKDALDRRRALAKGAGPG
jgi:glycosyltransferase involved in cell wall biosynthesis